MLCASHYTQPNRTISFFRIAKAIELPIKFRNWDLVKYPFLPESIQHTGSVKTSNKVQTPRHVLVAFQKLKKAEKRDHSFISNFVDPKLNV